MITTLCNQFTARKWFQLRAVINLAIVFAGFVVVVFVLQIFIYPLIADVIAIAMAYIAFFHILNKRAIAITCPRCDAYIETNTPWTCGNFSCRRDNERVNDYPFVHQCQHCGVEQKAYECPSCGDAIYLTKDRIKDICATIIKPRQKAEPPPPKVDPEGEKRRKQQQEKSDLEHDVEMARLKAKLKEEESKNAEPPPKKTAYEDLEEYFKNMMANETAEREWRAIIDEKFKNDPVARAKAHAVVDQWMRNRPDM
jgi:hypothetical protein